MVPLFKSRLVVFVLAAALLVALVPALPEAQAAGGGSVAYGQTVSGQLSNKSFFDLWEFTGQKGDYVRITMVGDGMLDPYLGLIEKSSEEVIVEDDDSGGNSNALIETTLPTGGTFVIVATRYDFDAGTSQGQYQLELIGGAGPQTQNTSFEQNNAAEPQEVATGVYYMGDIEMGATISGSIAANSFAQIYTLQLEKGADVMVVMAADNSQLDPYIIFATEAGDVLAEDDDSGATVGAGSLDSALQLTVPQTGTYMVIATRAGLDSGMSTGDYVLVAGAPEQSQPSNSDLPAGVEYLGDMSIDTSATGTIGPDSFAHLYTFDANAGEMITVTMAGDGALDPYLGILDVNGDVVAEDDDSGGGTGGLDAQIAIRLPEAGSYTIVATRAGIDQGSTTGDYTLTLSSGSPTPPSTGVAGIGGFGGLPGRAFEVEGQTFYLRGFGATHEASKQSELELYLHPEQGLPGRSFNVDGQQFVLRGFGASDNPAKMSPLAAYLSQ